VIDVAYCADIYMGFAAIKFFLGHFFGSLGFDGVIKFYKNNKLLTTI